MKMRHNRTFNKIAAFTSAGLIGAGVALLLAPRPGGEMRRSLIHLGKNARKRSGRLWFDFDKKMNRLFSDIRDDVKSYVDSGKHWSDEKNRELERAFKTGKQYVERELEKVLPS